MVLLSAGDIMISFMDFIQFEGICIPQSCLVITYKSIKYFDKNIILLVHYYFSRDIDVMMLSRCYEKQTQRMDANME